MKDTLIDLMNRDLTDNGIENDQFDTCYHNGTLYAPQGIPSLQRDRENTEKI